MIFKKYRYNSRYTYKKIKDAYAKLSVEKKGALTFQSGGLPIPPSQKPKEEHFTYDGLIDKLKDKLVVIQGNIITCGDDYFL